MHPTSNSQLFQRFQWRVIKGDHNRRHPSLRIGIATANSTSSPPLRCVTRVAAASQSSPRHSCAIKWQASTGTALLARAINLPPFQPILARIEVQSLLRPGEKLRRIGILSGIGTPDRGQIRKRRRELRHRLWNTTNGHLRRMRCLALRQSSMDFRRQRSD